MTAGQCDFKRRFERVVSNLYRLVQRCNTSDCFSFVISRCNVYLINVDSKHQRLSELKCARTELEMR